MSATILQFPAPAPARIRGHVVDAAILWLLSTLACIVATIARFVLEVLA